MADVRRLHSNPELENESFLSRSSNRLSISPPPRTDSEIYSISVRLAKVFCSQPLLNGTAHQHFFAVLDTLAKNPRVARIHFCHANNVRRITQIVSRYLSVNLDGMVARAATNEQGLARATVVDQQESVAIHVRVPSGSDDYQIRFTLDRVGKGSEKLIKEAIEVSKHGVISHIAQIKKSPQARPKSPELEVEVSLLQRLSDRHVPHIPKITERKLLRKNSDYKTRYDMEMAFSDLLEYTKKVWSNVEEKLTIDQEDKFLVFACQIAEGLAGIHEVNVCHLDVKPENVLLTHFGDVLIIDFGNALMFGASTTTRGSPGYQAPEMLFSEQIQANPASDVWSFGVLLFVLFNGYNPFGEEQKKYYMAKALKAAHLIEEASREFLITYEKVHRELCLRKTSRDSLIAHMLALNPDDRPKMVIVYDALLKLRTRK